MKPSPTQVGRMFEQAFKECAAPDAANGDVLVRLAELAAAWGAEQERARWLKENAPGGWIDDLRKQAQQTTAELPEAVGYMNAGHVHELTQRRIHYGYVYPKKETGASVAVYTADQMHDHYQAGVRAGMGQSQDARRYQWLREQQWQDNKLGVVLRPKDNTVLGCFIPSKELLDGAIDRYMSGKNDAMQGGQQ